MQVVQTPVSAKRASYVLGSPAPLVKKIRPLSSTSFPTIGDKDASYLSKGAPSTPKTPRTPIYSPEKDGRSLAPALNVSNSNVKPEDTENSRNARGNQNPNHSHSQNRQRLFEDVQKRIQSRAHANRLRLRLQAAYYKVVTEQEKLPLTEITNIETSKSLK